MKHNILPLNEKRRKITAKLVTNLHAGEFHAMDGLAEVYPANVDCLLLYHVITDACITISLVNK